MKEDNFKPTSNDFGCICEQSWKKQRSMEVYITINRTKSYCSKSLIKLVITTENVFTFVMLLKRAALIGYMQAKGRPFYSNDVIWLHQVTVPLYQETVPLFELNQIQSKRCDTKLHFILNSKLIHVHNMRDKNPKSMVYPDAFPKSNGKSKYFCLS